MGTCHYFALLYLPLLLCGNLHAAESKINFSETNTPVLSSTVSLDSLHILAHSGQTKTAIALAQRYLRDHENADIRVYLARMLIWEKKYAEAKEHLLYVLAKNPGYYDAYEGLTDISTLMGDYDAALKFNETNLKYHPNHPVLLEKQALLKAKSLVALGKRADAIFSMQKFIQKHKGQDIRLYLGEQLSADNNYLKAKEVYISLLHDNPENTDATEAVAMLEVSLQHYNSALIFIDKGLGYEPNNQKLLSLRQTVLDKWHPKPILSSYLLPVNATFSKEIATKEKNTITFEEIKKLYSRGKTKEAIALANNALKNNKNSDIQLLLGEMYSWQKEYPLARKVLADLLQKNPANVEASRALTNVELWSLHKKEAIIVAKNGLHYHPKDKILLELLGRANGSGITYAEIKSLVDKHESNKAKALAYEALKLKDNVDIRLLLAYIESRDKNYTAAREQFALVLNKSPRYVDASYGLADVESWNGQYHRALEVINAALVFHPHDKMLMEKRAAVVQNLLVDSKVLHPNIFSRYNLPNAVGPGTPGGKLNALEFNQEVTHVSDLQEYWRISSYTYERYTRLGPILFTVNQTYRFNTPGVQYLLEAYPHLFKGAYMYVAFGTSNTSYLPQTYFTIEPYFSLPKAFELSLGERVMKFSSMVHLYTGSISKYVGNYWFSLRPYFTSGSQVFSGSLSRFQSSSGSQSYFFTIRRYFSGPDSYISVVAGAGVGSGLIDFLNPNSISADRSSSIRFYGEVPVNKKRTLILTWTAGHGYEHFPSNRVRFSNYGDAGFIWRF